MVPFVHRNGFDVEQLVDGLCEHLSCFYLEVFAVQVSVDGLHMVEVEAVLVRFVCVVEQDVHLDRVGLLILLLLVFEVGFEVHRLVVEHLVC